MIAAAGDYFIGKGHSFEQGMAACHKPDPPTNLPPEEHDHEHRSREEVAKATI